MVLSGQCSNDIKMNKLNKIKLIEEKGHAYV
jgi:hypothetical protein